MTGTYIGKTYTEYRREFVEHFAYGKQIGKILDIKSIKTSTGPNTYFWDWNMKNLETRFQILKNEKYLKFAHEMSVQNGCDAFPNELTRFRIEATPIWEKTQKHCKNAVRI